MTRTIAALAAIVLFAATGAKAQTGKWGITEMTDKWGDPNGINIVRQLARAKLTIGGGSETVYVAIMIPCDKAVILGLGFFGSRRPNLEADRVRIRGRNHGITLPAKIDGVKKGIRMSEDPGMPLSNPEDLIGAKESLEILFAWGRNKQRQSLTWTMDGFSEAFSEACGEELDAEEG